MKKFLIYLGLTLFGLFVLFITLTGFLMIDEKLNPEAKAFFYPDPYNPDNNLYNALVGLHAPIGVEDTEAYGRQLIMSGQDFAEDSLYFEEGDISLYNCTSQAPHHTPEECTTPEQAWQIAAANRVILDRYKDLWQRTDMRVSVGDRFVLPWKGQSIIAMQQLLSILWVDMARTGHGEEAIEEWIASTRFLQQIPQGKLNVVEHAIWLVIYNLNLGSLPVILGENPELISKYKTQLKAVLSNSYMSLWNIEDMMRAEYNLFYLLENHVTQNGLKWSLEDNERISLSYVNFKPRATINSFYRNTQRIIQLPAHNTTDLFAFEKSPYNDVCLDKTALKEKVCHLYNPVGGLFLLGVVKGGELIKNAKYMDMYKKSLIIWMNAKEQNIAPENMAEFVRQQDAALKYPETDLPLGWDAETGEIVPIHESQRFNKERNGVFYP